MKKLWFKAKHYGWGWYPCSWEGWLVVFTWAILFFFSIDSLGMEWFKNLIVIILFTAVLIWISYKKGEKPRWKWRN
jgi:hypothetical protein